MELSVENITMILGTSKTNKIDFRCDGRRYWVEYQACYLEDDDLSASLGEQVIVEAVVYTRYNGDLIKYRTFSAVAKPEFPIMRTDYTGLEYSVWNVFAMKLHAMA